MSLLNTNIKVNKLKKSLVLQPTSVPYILSKLDFSNCKALTPRNYGWSHTFYMGMKNLDIYAAFRRNLGWAVTSQGKKI